MTFTSCLQCWVNKQMKATCTRMAVDGLMNWFKTGFAFCFPFEEKVVFQVKTYETAVVCSLPEHKGYTVDSCRAEAVYRSRLPWHAPCLHARGRWRCWTSRANVKLALRDNSGPCGSCKSSFVQPQMEIFWLRLRWFSTVWDSAALAGLLSCRYVGSHPRTLVFLSVSR